MKFVPRRKLQNRSVGNEIIRVNVSKFVTGSFLFQAANLFRVLAVFAFDKTRGGVHSRCDKKIDPEFVANGFDLKNRGGGANNRFDIVLTGSEPLVHFDRLFLPEKLGFLFGVDRLEIRIKQFLGMFFAYFAKDIVPEKSDSLLWKKSDN